LLQQLDDLKIAENTIVVYTTDNGAELALWPDGAMTPFHGEKGTTWEGGFRIPMMVRWPGVVKPGTISNDIISLLDWFPTLCAAAGLPDIKEKMAQGFTASGKSFKVHLDGYNFMPYLEGKATAGPRDAIYYFDQGGNLNAIRWNDWKVSFAVSSSEQMDGLPLRPLRRRTIRGEKGLGLLREHGERHYHFSGRARHDFGVGLVRVVPRSLQEQLEVLVDGDRAVEHHGGGRETNRRHLPGHAVCRHDLTVHAMAGQGERGAERGQLFLGACL
jgi:hypothetical protein